MTPEADRLADALRRLLGTAVSTAADPDALRAATALVEDATAVLAPVRADPSPLHAMAFRHAYSIVTGSAHPLAPPVRLTEGDGEVRGAFCLGKQYEGGPGLVHGGILSLVLDHVFGEAALAAGVGGMTVGLDVRFVAPTPLHTDLEVVCRVADVDGRKVRLTGEITRDGTPTVTATALFVQIDAATAAQLFPQLSPS